MSNTMLKIKTLLSKILTWIKNPRTLSGNGYQWDDYGNLKHLRSNTSDTLNIRKEDGTVVARINYESGRVELLTENLRLLSTNHGVFGTDSTGFVYPFAFDNGSNLWIGSTMTATQHHRGETFISTGYNGSEGNETIKVCVPNSSNTGGTSYMVIHEGLTKSSGVTINGVKYMTIGATQATKSGSAWTGGNLTLYRRGNMVHLTGSCTLTALTARTTVATIANTNLRPYAQVYAQVNGGSDFVLINSNGTIQFNAGSAGTKYFSVDYMAAT